MSNYRISKVLSELNIGLDTAVDYLKSKGHEVEKNRNAKVDQAQYDLLLESFASDKTSKDEAETLIQQKRDEKEAIQAERIEAEKAKPEVIRASAKLEGPKIAGKIDLSLKPKAAPVKAAAPAPAPVKTQVIKEEAKPVVKAQEAAKPEVLTAAEPTPVKEEAAISPEAPAASVEPINSEASEPAKVDGNHATQYQKLDGPKLTGQTIDLTQFAKKPKPPGEAGKRKRIKTEGLQKPAAGGGRTTTGAASVGGPRRDNNRPGLGSRRVAPAGPPKEVSKEDIARKIKETLEKLGGGRKSKGSKMRRDKRAERTERREMEELERIEGEKILKLTEFVTLLEVANMMGVAPTEVISTCMSLGIMASMNQRLDKETLTIVADEFGYEVEFVDKEMQEVFNEEDITENLVFRSPIVTVMGHVDHGKTSLLDFIRKDNVIAGEAGGITQHIGAYSVELATGQRIAFLDTPGHEAFTAMRARGAQVTDIVIIVISADDSVMPQTKEAISHAQAAGVPMIIAINKIDRPDANPERIKEQLSQMNILVEDWGGKIQSQEISAKSGLNVDKLLEKVLLESEMLDLKADPGRKAKGTVIEATLDKGRGYVTTLLNQSGTLRIGDYILVGPHSGKVRAMMDERGNKLKEVGPSMPVSILGLDGAPQAGDNYVVMEDEREAKNIATRRQQLSREQSVRSQKNLTLEEIGRRLAVGDFQELNIVLKGDVDGSIEALADSLQRLSTEEIQVNIIHKAVGGITDSDVLLASASKAVIVGFQVRPAASARKLAEKEDIEIRLYSIIYDAINDIKDAMSGMLSPDLKEEITCTLEIRETFKISKVGTIAGCMVTDGTITRSTRVRIIREGVVVYTGELGSLKRFKDDVKEVKKGMDCGLNIKNFNDIKVGDIIEGFKEVEVQREL
ncbi:MAG: translation initiation factor IF-2 [Schleiferiaceae bacterium]|nr:translation initiation factor IF-2 [Schleiferiaceae bacterium]